MASSLARILSRRASHLSLSAHISRPLIRSARLRTEERAVTARDASNESHNDRRGYCVVEKEGRRVICCWRRSR
jgi:hypothetical protein